MVWMIFEYLAVISLFCVNCVYTSSNTIDVDKTDCAYYTSYRIDQFKTYEIVWHGYSSFTACRIGFYARGDDIYSVDDYKICVEPVIWSMHNCASKLYLKYNDVKSVFCREKNPDTHCSHVNTNLDIEVEMHRVHAWRANTTSFTLKVYAQNTTYYGVGLISACTLLWILILAFCILSRRRRSSRGHRRRSSSIYSLSGIDNRNFVASWGPSPPPYLPRDDLSPPPYSVADPNKGDNPLSHI